MTPCRILPQTHTPQYNAHTPGMTLRSNDKKMWSLKLIQCSNCCSFWRKVYTCYPTLRGAIKALDMGVRRYSSSSIHAILEKKYVLHCTTQGCYHHPARVSNSAPLRCSLDSQPAPCLRAWTMLKSSSSIRCFHVYDARFFEIRSSSPEKKKVMD